MSVKLLDRPAMDSWVAALIRGRPVYAPQARGDRFVYDRLAAAADLRLDHDVTILPPRKYLMPPAEALLKFTRAGDFVPVMDGEPFVLLGVHPYDVAGIAQMDRYFSQDNPDAHYLARRKNAAIVACDAQNAGAYAFAGSMGTATVREGFDVLLTLVGDKYIAEAGTAVGESLLALAGHVPEADAVSLGRREQVWQDAQKLLQRQALACRPQDLPALLARHRDNPVWQKKSEQCFSCGSCTMVCPSCFCFDVQDDTEWNLAGGTRCRQWDSCMLSEFALVAGGHNFRKRRGERYRHRFYRKGKYLCERCGFVACVGCGRCAAACTAGIANPVELYNALLEAQ